MTAMTVAECHAQGGRLDYVGDRPVCVLPVGDGETIALALDTGLPVDRPAGADDQDKKKAPFGAILFFGAAVIALLFSRGRRR